MRSAADFVLPLAAKICYNRLVENCPIAIVGFSCRFAGAPNPGALWRAVTDGRAHLSAFKEDVARPGGVPGVFPRPYPTCGGVLGHASDGDDLYFKVSKGGENDPVYTFTVESYLTGPGTDVYEAVKNLKIGDTVDMEGYLYWYEGANPHITSVTVK